MYYWEIEDQLVLEAFLKDYDTNIYAEYHALDTHEDRLEYLKEKWTDLGYKFVDHGPSATTNVYPRGDEPQRYTLGSRKP